MFLIIDCFFLYKLIHEIEEESSYSESPITLRKIKTEPISQHGNEISSKILLVNDS